jgi:hypothetical protein
VNHVAVQPEAAGDPEVRAAELLALIFAHAERTAPGSITSGAAAGAPGCVDAAGTSRIALAATQLSSTPASLSTLASRS